MKIGKKNTLSFKKKFLDILNEIFILIRTKFSINASTASKLSIYYMYNFNKYKCRENIKKQIDEAVGRRKFIVNVETPLDLEEKILNMLKKKNYMIMKDTSREMRFDDFSGDKPKYKSIDYINLAGRTNFYIVWVGSDEFFKKVLLGSKISSLDDKKRGDAIINYIREETGIHFYHQNWIHPKINGRDSDGEKDIYQLGEIARKL